MISFFSIIKIVIWFLLIPFLLGLSANKTFRNEGISIPLCMVFGFAVMLAIFQIYAVPMIAFSTPFHVLKNVWVVTILILVFISVVVNKKTLIDRDFLLLRKSNSDNFTKIVFLVSVVIIAFQTWLLTFNMHTDTDDVRFISEALEAFECDTMLKLHPITGVSIPLGFGELPKDMASPYPFFIGLISKIINVHPAITAHIFLPAALIPLCYGMLYIVGEYFLEEKKKIAVYMLLLSVIMLFSFESVYALGYTLLTIIWQGRSIVATIMLPILWYVLMRIITDNESNNKRYFWTIVIVLACADLSGMGIVMSAFLCFVYSIAMVIQKKDIKSAIITMSAIIPNIGYFLYYYLSSRFF